MTTSATEKTWMGLRGDLEVIGNYKVETCGTLRVNGVLRVEAKVYSAGDRVWIFEGFSRPRISPRAGRVSAEYILEHFNA